MTSRATVVRIMIASPADVEHERRAAVDLIHEWNAVHASDRSTVLLPAAWESHASPEMGSRPQAIINRQLLRDCDILVAIFWTRLGSPTGVSASGTVEEIEEHLKAGKRVILYFSSAPVHPDSVDSFQLESLRGFKERCKKDGLFQEYGSIGEFRELFARHLAQTVIRNFPIENDAGESGAVGRPTFVARPVEPKLGQAAHDLLLAAARKDGHIISVGTLGGHHVQAGGRDFVEAGGRRSEARWLAAIEELETRGFVEDRAHKGEVFMVTQAGYDYSDSYF